MWVCVHARACVCVRVCVCVRQASGVDDLSGLRTFGTHFYHLTGLIDHDSKHLGLLIHLQTHTPYVISVRACACVHVRVFPRVCVILQHTANIVKQCNTLQHIAPHCDTLQNIYLKNNSHGTVEVRCLLQPN